VGRLGRLGGVGRVGGVDKVGNVGKVGKVGGADPGPVEGAIISPILPPPQIEEAFDRLCNTSFEAVLYFAV
jgi:hypothetical protein